MIQSFRDSRARELLRRARVMELVNIEDQARSRLIRLDAAMSLQDLRAIRGNRLEALAGSRQGQFSIRINDQYRICFRWKRKDQPMSKSPITTKPGTTAARRKAAGKKLPPIHAGRILLEDMRDEEISINGLAQAIRVPSNRISLIVNGKRGITADTAARLARFFGTSPQYWLNIQNRYELESLDLDAIGREVIPRRAA